MKFAVEQFIPGMAGYSDTKSVIHLCFGVVVVDVVENVLPLPQYTYYLDKNPPNTYTQIQHMLTLHDQGHICLLSGAWWLGSVCAYCQASSSDSISLRNNHDGNFRLHPVSAATLSHH